MGCVHDLTGGGRPPLVPCGGHFAVRPPRVLGHDLPAVLRGLGRACVGKRGSVVVVQRSGEVVSIEEHGPEVPLDVVDALAEGALGPGVTVLVGRAVVSTGRETVYREVDSYTLGDLIARAAAGVSSLDLVLASVGRVEKAAKKSPVDRHAALLDRELAAAAAGTVDTAVEELVELAEVTDWTELGLARSGPVITQMAGKLLGSGEAFAGKITAPLLAAGMRTIQGVRRWTAQQHGWGPGGRRVPAAGPIRGTFDLADRNAVAGLRRSTVNFVTDEFGKRSAKWSEFARRVVARGFEQGLGRDEIAADLSRWIRLRGGNPHYYRVVAGAYTVRADSWSRLSTYKRAGVELARFLAQLDERTTEQCRWADGKYIHVGDGLAHMERTMQLAEPDDIRYESPWLRERLLDREAGTKELFIKQRDGTELRIAEVTRPALGIRDDRGEHRTLVPAKEGHLPIELGIGPPPLHGACRSELAPVIV